jgi:predicted DNA-binding protein (MmcQ/YjbR family)
MDLEFFQRHCLSKKGVTEEFPFGEDTFVYKVVGKMFAITSIDFPSVNLKCDPEQAILLRERYTAVQPGYHMNKQHWNTVMMDGSVPDKMILKWTNDSYDLIVESLNKSQKSILDRL